MKLNFFELEFIRNFSFVTKTLFESLKCCYDENVLRRNGKADIKIDKHESNRHCFESTLKILNKSLKIVVAFRVGINLHMKLKKKLIHCPMSFFALSFSYAHFAYIYTAAYTDRGFMFWW